MACSTDSFSPKAFRSPMFIEHRPNHLNKSEILSFHDFILLRNTWGRELLINTMLKTKLIERDIPELREKNECNHKKNHENLLREQHEMNQ
jgi:hypothetical protein